MNEIPLSTAAREGRQLEALEVKQIAKSRAHHRALLHEAGADHRAVADHYQALLHDAIGQARRSARGEWPDDIGRPPDGGDETTGAGKPSTPLLSLPEAPSNDTAPHG
jgi:hypothetical protein